MTLSTDRYTKILLTIIAGALCVIAANGVRKPLDLVSEAHAVGSNRGEPVRLVDVDEDLVVDVRVTNADEIGKQVASWLKKRSLTSPDITVPQRSR